MATQTVKNATVHNTKGDIFSSFDVADFAVPHGKDEVWRFVPLRRLRGLHDGSFTEPVAPKIAVTVPSDATGISVSTIAKNDPRVGRAGAPVDRVSAQAFSSAQDVTLVSFAKNTVITDPVEIKVEGAEATSFAHIVVAVETGAEAVIDLRYTGNGTMAPRHTPRAARAGITAFLPPSRHRARRRCGPGSRQSCARAGGCRCRPCA